MNALIGYLRLLYRLPWLLLHVLVGTPATVACQYGWAKKIRLGRRSLQETMAIWWSGTMCRIFGLRIRPRGTFRDGAQLVVANHIAWIDIPLMHSQAFMGFVSKAEIARWPVVGFMAKSGGTLFHQRGCRDSASGVASVMEARLEEDGRVAIFPEGGILPGHGIKRFHGRLFAAAIHTGSPVQPVMLRYLRDGRHAPDISFLPGEHFVANFFRLLRQAPCVAEVVVLPLIDSAGKQRRPLAAEAEAVVRAEYDRGLNDG
jgi:1-acyl-sn-glycerol-3-phosphate acyltransferase